MLSLPWVLPLALLALQAPAAAPPPAVPTARPAARPTLQAACDARAKWLRARVDRRFHIRVLPPFVIAGRMSAWRFKRLVRRGVTEPARALWASYFARKPTRPVTVLLLRGRRSYKHWARKVFGDVGVPYFGYYKPSTRTLVMDVGTGIGTLWHELTHALLAADFPQVPDWFNEGLASLHEGCLVRGARMIGYTNWRYRILGPALRGRRLRSLKQLITRDDFYGPLVGINYAHARFLVQYLQHKKKLRPFYRRFRRSGPARDLGLRVLEQVLGQPIAAIDRDFRTWARRLR